MERWIGATGLQQRPIRAAFECVTREKPTPGSKPPLLRESLPSAAPRRSGWPPQPNRILPVLPAGGRHDAKRQGGLGCEEVSLGRRNAPRGRRRPLLLDKALGSFAVHRDDGAHP